MSDLSPDANVIDGQNSYIEECNMFGEQLSTVPERYAEHFDMLRVPTATFHRRDMNFICF